MKIEDLGPIKYYMDKLKPTIKNVVEKKLREDTVEISNDIVLKIKRHLNSLPEIRTEKINDLEKNIDINKLIDKLIDDGILP